MANYRTLRDLAIRNTHDIDFGPTNCVRSSPAAGCLDDFAAERPIRDIVSRDDLRFDVVLLEGGVPRPDSRVTGTFPAQWPVGTSNYQTLKRLIRRARPENLCTDSENDTQLRKLNEIEESRK